MENSITLRPVIDTDLPVFYQHQKDPQAAEMAAFPMRELEQFMAHWAKIRADEKVIIRTILYNHEVAGNIHSFDMEAKREVGFWLGREFWGKGIASEALAAFIHLEPVRPLYGYAARHNIGSQRVLEKCGFESIGKEGVYRVLVLQ
jgi:RimJ/RimL family protein N-acetyltransferase